MEEEEEHEVYGGEIPDEGDMDADVDMARPDEDAAKVFLSHPPFPLEILRICNPNPLVMSIRFSCRSWTR